MTGFCKVKDLNDIYYLEDGEIIWSSIEEYLEHKQEEYEGIKDNIEMWEDSQLENLEEYTGRELIDKLIKDYQEEIIILKKKLEEK